eukprot:CAMPEP_0182841356 /NCGR_PEP_ID=MMETSP0006_2-20121128/24987_1 /TAXON_ID=97485 /ORGANISM="Prymnesium parvum, Strain Texoma1" /LENGTH=58 /DNA_ID=CAMNT_0024970829 /DNA_START=96 /DNA_END=272 /DNA_ORIENTATION=-
MALKQGIKVMDNESANHLVQEPSSPSKLVDDLILFHRLRHLVVLDPLLHECRSIEQVD